MIARNLLRYLFVFLSVVWYILVYYYIDRSEFIFLTSGIVVLGGAYLYWVTNKSFNGKQIVVLAILFRLLLLFGTPNLSDDFYRFYWDGELNNSGVNPYEYTPAEIMMNEDVFDKEKLNKVFSSLNSQEYYSVYPPVNQWIFSATTFFSGGDLSLTILFLKLFVFFFDIALIVVLIQLLKKLLLPVALAQIYALNPLVIIELTGNIHFEGVMLLFLVIGLFYLWNQRLILASLSFSLSIGIKLMPLILLPLFLPMLGFKKSSKLYLGIGLFFFLACLPFASQEVISNFYQSLELYFYSFEFNGSIYYLVKEVSYIIHGFKAPWVGFVLPLCVLFSILTIVVFLWRTKPFLRNSKFDLLVFSKYASYCLGIYYLCATTVHPWYIINLLFFSVLVPIRAVLYWSLFIFVSYIAYSEFTNSFAPNSDYNSYWLYYVFMAVQYIFCAFIFTFDLIKNKTTT